MKKLAFTLMMMVSVFAFSEDASINQSSDVTNAGSMNMYGYGSSAGSNTVPSYDSFGGGVSCAQPTLSVSAEKVWMPHSNDVVSTGLTLAIPLGDVFEPVDTCKKAANAKINDMTAYTEERAKINKGIARNEAAKATLAEGNVAKLCIHLHSIMSADQDSDLWDTCAAYAPIVKDHHKGGPELNTALIPNTHRRISPNRQDR